LAVFRSTDKLQRKKSGWGRENIVFCWGISITDASKPALKEKNDLLSQRRVAFYSLSRFSLDSAVNRWAGVVRRF